MEDLGTIVGVWAHPDDETYLMGGVMADAIRRGRRVVCVTATRGEAGSQDEERWPSSEIAAIRETELIDALGVLGVHEHHWLGFHDGQCEAVDHDDGVAKVQAILDDVGPDSVLTFGPDGQTGHPDHISVHRWTTDAFRRTARPGACLYYATTSPEWADRFVPGLNRYNVFGPGTPAVTPRDQLGVDARLPPELLDLKIEALRRQPSQVEGLFEAMGEDFTRDALADETFVLGLRA